MWDGIYRRCGMVNMGDVGGWKRDDGWWLWKMWDGGYGRCGMVDMGDVGGWIWNEG